MRSATIDAYELLARVRRKKPLVHHLTNWVTINDCANIVKAFGASPVMAHAKEEAAEMATLAQALVLNIGTLTSEFAEAMKLAARSANRKGIPVVLDVCGAGATTFRDKKSFELLKEVRIDIIKGNASEIARIAGERVVTKGVDSTEVKKDIVRIAKKLSKKRGCTVVVTGATDIVTDGGTAYLVRNGHPLMALLVGTGCMSTSVVGMFAAVENDLALAAASGLACFNIAAECAARKAAGPATFKERLFDCAFRLDKGTIRRLQRVER